MSETTAKKFNVKIAQLGGEIVEVEVEEGMTIRQGINKAGLSTKNLTDVRQNAEPSSLDAILEPDAIVTLVPNVEGGR